MTQECGPEAYTDLAKARGLAAQEDFILLRVYQISDLRSRDMCSEWSRGYSYTHSTCVVGRVEGPTTPTTHIRVYS